MKLHLGMMDILVIVALVFAGIIAHNMYNNHPTADQMKILTKYAKTGEAPKGKKIVGGGGLSSAPETAGTGAPQWSWDR